MADTTRTRTTTTRSSSSRRSLGARMTAKVGPLPVWAWAVLLLAVGYLVYRLRGGGSSSSSSTTTSSDTAGSTDTGSTTGSSTDLSTAGDVGPAAAGSSSPDVGQLSDQIAGLSAGLDSLTAAVQSSPAFWPGSGDAGSGSTVPNGNTPPPPAATAPAQVKPAASTSTAAPARTRYWTYAPGKAPKNRKGDEAPAHGPRGTRLHFAAGRGYYYA